MAAVSPQTQKSPKTPRPPTRAVWLLLALLFTACDPQFPNAVLRIDDPDSVAEEAVAVRIQREGGEPSTVELEGNGFPVTVTLTSFEREQALVLVDALDTGGEPIGHGRATVSFVQREENLVDVVLGIPCDADLDCDDGLFCTGAERCREGKCSTGEAPCSNSPYSCVVIDCLETGGGDGVCDVEVSHNVCEPTVTDGGVIEPTYCDVAEGCRPGIACYEDVDCDDGAFCNGEEKCLDGRCVGGTPAETDDGNPCTLDGCDDVEDRVFSLPLGDGDPCFFDGEGSDVGYCLDVTCVTTRCGDGYLDVDAGEACDDGNENDLDGCRNDCQKNTWSVAPVIGGSLCDGHVVDNAAWGNPGEMTLAPDGSLIFSDDDHNVVRRFDPQTRLISRVAGSGIDAHDIAGVPAVTASLKSARNLAVNPVTGHVYILERGSTGRVVYVDDEGLLQIAAGNLESSDVGSGTDAQNVRLTDPESIAFTAEGDLLIVEGWGNWELNRVPTVGDDAFTITRAGGGGSPAPSGPSLDLNLEGMYRIARAANDELIVSQRSGASQLNQGLARFAPAGDGTFTVSRLAGLFDTCELPVDGAVATATGFCNPRHVVADAFGDVACANLSGEHGVFCIDQSGVVSRAVGTGSEGLPTTGDDPLLADVSHIRSLLKAPDGGLYILGEQEQYATRYLVHIAADKSTLTFIYGGQGVSERRCGVGGPASGAHVDSPEDVDVLPDGSVLTSAYSYFLVKVAPDGSTTEAIPSPAVTRIATGPDGQIVGVYWSGEIRRVDAAGENAYFIGGGGEDRADGATGSDIAFGDVVDIAMPADDTVYVLERGYQTLRKLSRLPGAEGPGSVWAASTIAGNGSPDPNDPGGVGPAQSLFFPRTVAVSPAGVPYLGDGGGRLRRVNDGMLENVGTFDDEIEAMDFDGAGNLIVATADHRVWLLPASDDGVDARPVSRVHVAGNGLPAIRSGPGATTAVHRPRDLRVGPDGTIYLAIPDAHRVVSIVRDAP